MLPVAHRSIMALMIVSALVVALIAANPAAAAKSRRVVVSTIFEVGHSDQFVIAGRLKQTYRRRPLIVQQRFNGGRWSAYTRTRSSAASRFRIRVDKRGVAGDVVCYRLIVPGNRRYRRTVVLKASRGRYAGKWFCIETIFGAVLPNPPEVWNRPPRDGLTKGRPMSLPIPRVRRYAHATHPGQPADRRADRTRPDRLRLQCRGGEGQT